ncbi:molybdopterin-guanine dinucleotide biosynthesis protein MobB [Desulfonatronospira sp.]|uniref:molybdopterin-guanine dinucleotide biosynthesis protein MobB n=1 Tax=Desulfonatronospira sp. TaxID=1962951 RepID=UPI0025C23861|nr:molybdopterin-guanine dinucleotide biosynthesis protein MobB [Desulfonatronospira sp.]
MIQALSIVGYKKSGKTGLMLKLARELQDRGVKTAAAKFSQHGFDHENTDTAKFSSVVNEVIGLSQEQSFINWKEKKYLPDLIPLLQAGMLLVEGGKHLGWLPRVIILKKPGDAEALDRGLAIATWGKIKTHYLPHAGSIEDLADIARSRAFALPGLDCGTCGREKCLDLAREIVADNARLDDCQALHSRMKITVNNQALAMNPFVERIITRSILGMLSELKGYTPGKINISIE